ncbi:MAG: hypothetical protein HYY18_07665 [Planctomycetes bacterium]|nr:hypothetical protein [Planctomycetota bacterium]
MCRNFIEIREEVLTFDTADQERWTGGDKALLPEEYKDDPRFTKQPRAHFLEMSALNHFRSAGYKVLYSGWYELWAKTENRKPWLERGASELEAFLGPELDAFRKVVGATAEKFAKAPDLVVWKTDPKRLMFCEVKQKNETVSQPEWAGLALVKGHLGADARVLRYCELGDFRDPRKWKVRCPGVPTTSGFERHDIQRVEE